MATRSTNPASSTKKEKAQPDGQNDTYFVFYHNDIIYEVPERDLWWPSALSAQNIKHYKKERKARQAFCKPRPGGRTARNTINNTPNDKFTTKPPRYSMVEAENDDIREARTEARRASQAAKENGTKGSKRKRDEMNDDQEETFSDAHAGLTDDEDQYLSAVEEQPAVWPILRRRRGRGRGSKSVKIVD